MFVLGLISLVLGLEFFLSFACCVTLVVYLWVVILAVFVCGGCAACGWVCLIVVLVFVFVWCVAVVLLFVGWWFACFGVVILLVFGGVVVSWF